MEMYKTCFCVERLNIINMPVLRKRIYKFKTLISVYTFNAIVIRILILRTGQSSFKFYMGKIILHFKCSEKNSEENYKWGGEQLQLVLKRRLGGFPGGAVVENLPANAGDTGSSPGLGRSHMPRSNWACEPQLLSLHVWSLCSATREAVIVRGPCTVMKSGPRLPQLEKALTQKRRPNTAINK